MICKNGLRLRFCAKISSMNRLALGTAQFGMKYGIANTNGQVTAMEAQEILSIAKSNNIDTIDTAINYNESEGCLGNIGVRNFKMITKLPSLPLGISDPHEWIYQQIEASLKRLKIEKLYGLLLHSSEQFVNASIRLVLKDLKECDKVKKIGVSIYSPDELDRIPIEEGIDIVQAPLNLVDQRLVSSGWLQILHDNKIEIHTRSAFLQGLLVMPRTLIPDRFSKWDNIWDTWHDWLNSNDISAVQGCLNFVLSLPEIDKVIVGVDTVSQLKKLIKESLSPISTNSVDIASNDNRLVNPCLW